MKQTKIISVIAVICGCIAVSSTNAATLPAGTTITVSTVSAFSSKTVAGRSFEAKRAMLSDIGSPSDNEPLASNASAVALAAVAASSTA